MMEDTFLKRILLLSVLCVCYAQQNDNQLQLETKWSLCEKVNCENKRGYFTNSHFVQSSHLSPPTLVKNLHSAQEQDFVVVITTLRRLSTDEYEDASNLTLEVCSSEDEGSCEVLLMDRDYLRVFRRTRNVQFRTANSRPEALVRYYAGCQLVEEGAGLELSRVPVSTNRCWVMIPSRDDRERTAAAVFATVDRISLFATSTLRISNAITGELISSFWRGSDSDVIAIPHDQTLHYDGSEVVAPVLVELAPGRSFFYFWPFAYSFSVRLNVLNFEDARCLSRERVCSIDGTSFSCEIGERCHRLQQIIVRVFSYDQPTIVHAWSKKTSTRPQQKQQTRIVMAMRMCAKKAKKLEHRIFCLRSGVKTNCKKFRGCYAYCKFYQNVVGVCEKTSFSAFK